MIAIEVTRFIKTGGPLTKRLHLTADGKLDNDSTQCQMATGRIERIQLDDWREFGPLIEATPRNVAWALGVMRDGLPGAAHLVVKDDPQAGKPGFVARTADNLVYRPKRLALVLSDFDTKGMPADVRARIEALGGFAGALAAVCPGVADAGYIERRSTSAGVHNPETGATYPSEGRHLYLLAQDGADARRFLYALHDRAWLGGLGWHMVGKAGQMLERSVVDRMVCAPERLVFEAPPDLEAPLKQLERKATVHDGPPLDTATACPDLTARETARLTQLRAAAADDKKGEAATARAAFVEERAAGLVARGVDPAKARETAEAWSGGVLKEDVTLEFANPEIGTKTVADVLADPEVYIDKALADPIEGIEYGRQTAKVLRHRATGEPFILSYAHGGAQYRLIRDDAASAGVTLNDFYAYMPMHTYLFVPSRDTWATASVNARIPAIPTPDGKATPASAWLDRHRSVEQMTWAPGEPMLIRGRLISKGGWIERKGVSCFNLYMPPTIVSGDKDQAGPWLELVEKVFPDDADRLIDFFAHRAQRPQEKINHGLVLGGPPGIGKDTILEPVKQTIGPWNFIEERPAKMFDGFNGYQKAVILRISEAHDLGDFDRYAFYEHMKILLAAPPDVLEVNEKHLREYYIPNCVAPIITTNHKTDGLFLPSDDRRHDVAWSDQKPGDFADGYWNGIYRWYGEGGFQHVAAYLRTRDISDFDPKAPPPKTAAFWAIVDAGRSPEDAELADILDGLTRPNAVTLEMLRAEARSQNKLEFEMWLGDRKNRRVIPHRMEKCGYAPVRNEYADDGLFKIGDRRQAVYAREDLSLRDRFAAANKLALGKAA